MPVQLRVTFDRRANAAYIYLTEIETGGVAKTVHVENAPGFINLDFNARGRLPGIEVLDASRRLPYELLERAEWI
jgi:uncharacterized protein YuzE